MIRKFFNRVVNRAGAVPALLLGVAALVGVSLGLAACAGAGTGVVNQALPSAGADTPGASEETAGTKGGPADKQGDSGEMMEVIIDGKARQKAVDALVEIHVKDGSPGEKERVERGVAQVAMYWNREDGTREEFHDFCLRHFTRSGPGLDTLLARYERAMEALDGYRVYLTRTLREPLDLAAWELIPVDVLMASLNPFTHVTEDAFATKVAFVALLNFPLYDLDYLLANGEEMDRGEWAAARLTKRFSMRVPGQVGTAVTSAYMAAEEHVTNYNIHMANLLDARGERAFEGKAPLISHWGLRDEIKALYSDPVGNLEKQQLIARVMERIITQDLPGQVVNNPHWLWEPFSNRVEPVSGAGAEGTDAAEGTEVAAANGTEVEAGAGESGEGRDDKGRYGLWLDVFTAEQKVDPYVPPFPTHIDRKFNYQREIPEQEVEELLIQVVSNPVAGEIAALIRERLGRELQPFDIWYDGFKARGQIGEAELDRIVSQVFPDLAAFEAKIPLILEVLGFEPDTARFIASKIRVDGARGAGHAMRAGMKTDNAHLRTRVPAGGMDYKGYNIAMHELGHNVEQTISLHMVGSVLLAGVPNTAYTEALAFAFQHRDLQVLKELSPQLARMSVEEDPASKALDAFWSAFEISGVGLLDMKAWRYMQDNPGITAADLQAYTVETAREIWNQYYAPVFGVKDSTLLAIYSHLIFCGLYVPDYPLGYLIDAQLEEQFTKAGFAGEVVRIYSQGRLTPDAWTKGAVGTGLSAAPLVRAAEEGMGQLAGDRASSKD